MTAQSDGHTSVVHLRREFRNRVVGELSHLLGANPSITVDGQDWSALERLPGWCLLRDTELRQLTQIVGALFLVPCFRQSIDGTWLRDARETLGQPVFDAVLQTDLPVTRIVPLPETKRLPDMLSQCGVAVLLSTVVHDSLRHLFASRLAHFTGAQHTQLLPSSTALHLYLAAEQIRLSQAAFNGVRADSELVSA